MQYKHKIGKSNAVIILARLMKSFLFLSILSAINHKDKF